MVLYVNGVNEGTNSYSPDLVAGEEMSFGARTDGAGMDNPFSGMHTDITVWDRAITQAEVSAEYNDGQCLRWSIGEGQAPASTPTMRS